MGLEIATKEDFDVFRKALEVEFAKLTQGQRDILNRMDQLIKEAATPQQITSGYIPALEYMKAVGIKRWKFDQLIAERKIKAVKKKRKIYVPVEEEQRFFKDPSVR